MRHVAATEIQQLNIARNYLLVLARQSKNEYIELDSSLKSKQAAYCIVIYSLRQWRHLWITIVNVKP